MDFLKLSPLFSDKAPARHKRGRLLVQEPGHLGGSPRPHQDSLKIKPGAAAAGRGRSAGALFFFYLPASEPPASDPPAALRRDLSCARSIVRSKQKCCILCSVAGCGAPFGSPCAAFSALYHLPTPSLPVLCTHKRTAHTEVSLCVSAVCCFTVMRTSRAKKVLQAFLSSLPLLSQ